MELLVKRVNLCNSIDQNLIINEVLFGLLFAVLLCTRTDASFFKLK